MSVLDDITGYLDQVTVTDGKVSVSLTDSQADWLTDNIVKYVESSDPNAKIRTNLLNKVIIPSALKLYLPQTIFVVAGIVTVGFFIGRASN